MSVSMSVIGNGFQFLNANGDPLNGGKLYTYAAGTSTPQASYTSSSGGTPNANPIIMNSDGRPPNEIWLTDGIAYKLVLQDSAGVQIATYDNVYGALSSSSSIVTAVPQYVSAVGGSGNAITLTPTLAPSSYTSGLTYSFQAIANNSGATTVNVSGLGVVAMRSKEGAATTGGEIASGGMYLIEYNTSTSSFYLINSGRNSSAVYVPAWTSSSGTAPAIGNGTIAGFYSVVGNLCFVNIQLLFGAGSTFGSAGTWRFSLPFPFSAITPTFIQGGAFYKLAAGGLINPTAGNVTVWSQITTANPTVITLNDNNGSIRLATGAWGNGGSIDITAIYPIS